MAGTEISDPEKARLCAHESCAESPLRWQRPDTTKQSAWRARTSLALALLFTVSTIWNFRSIASASASRGATSLYTDLSRFSCAPLPSPYQTFRFHKYNDMPANLHGDYLVLAEDHHYYTDQTRDWPQHALEYYADKVLSTHPCHTDDPAAADAFYVPALPSTLILASLFDNYTPMPKEEYFDQVVGWLETNHTEIFKAAEGFDHFFPRWPVHETPGVDFYDESGIASVEGLDLFENGTPSKEWIRHAAQDIILPYPHPASPASSAAEQPVRDLLVLFMGTSVTDMRHRLSDQFKTYNEQRDPSSTLPALWQEMQDRGHPDNLDLNSRALFGPVVAGDSISSRRLYTLILAGVIPVIINDRIILPFEAFLDWTKFCLFVPEAAAAAPGFNLAVHLGGISQQQVADMQQNLAAVKRHFTYHTDHIVPGDAMDMFVREMALCSKKLRSALSATRRFQYFRGQMNDARRETPLAEVDDDEASEFEAVE